MRFSVNFGQVTGSEKSETRSLPQVRHLGEGRQLVWRRGFDVLATGKTKLSPDPRISVHQKGRKNNFIK